MGIQSVPGTPLLFLPSTGLNGKADSKTRFLPLRPRNTLGYAHCRPKVGVLTHDDRSIIPLLVGGTNQVKG